ncbi:MAG: hypothetical protein LKI80_03725 [Sporolactobacillus sp.]|nr:hypothetical protein [Sporolactobacillus sp.]
MSRRGRRGVVLTVDGGFETIRLKRRVKLSVGQTVYSEYLTRSSFLNRYVLTPVLAFGFTLFCIAPLTQSTFEPENNVAAYVNFDQRTSIEAAVDRHLRVVDVRPSGAAAHHIVPDPDALRGVPFAVFSHRLIERMDAGGDLPKGSLLLVTTAFTNQLTRSQRVSFGADLIQDFQMASQLLRQHGAAAKWLDASMTERKNAHAFGLSMGRYLLYMKAKSGGMLLTVERAKKLPAAVIEKNLAADPWHEMLNRLTGRDSNQLLDGFRSGGSEDDSDPFHDPLIKIKPKVFPHDNGSSYRSDFRPVA